MSSVIYSFSERPATAVDHEAEHKMALGALWGGSAAMREVFRLLERVGPTDAGVLLTGESGSGKAMAAQCLHELSARCNNPYVVINCGAIPAALIEAELFGGDRPGVFARAEGGTVLLDEITELPLEMQTRLLHVLEAGTYFKAGESHETRCDVRVIAATNRCPLTAIRNGQMREDLLYRLAVFPIEMPPLRVRGNDVELLADRFLDELNTQAGTRKAFSTISRMTLNQHSWPGNVRELKNCIERAFITADQTLELTPLNESRAVDGDAHYGDERRLEIRVGSRIHDMERSLIEATLDHFKGNKRRAADALGCSLKTLYNKLNGYSQRQELASS